jgi:hypothetical protein
MPFGKRVVKKYGSVCNYYRSFFHGRKMMYTTPSLYQAFEPSYILVISDNGNISREKLTYPHLTISQSVIG